MLENTHRLRAFDCRGSWLRKDWRTYGLRGLDHERLKEMPKWGETKAGDWFIYSGGMEIDAMIAPESESATATSL